MLEKQHKTNQTCSPFTQSRRNFPTLVINLNRIRKAAPTSGADLFGLRRQDSSQLDQQLQFSSRQGQLAPDQSPQMLGRRPARQQPSPQRPAQQPAQQARRAQPDQFRAGVDLQPRFQRLRAPPGAANEQFLQGDRAPAAPQPNGLVPMPPMPQLNFGPRPPQPSQPGANQNQAGQLPTLSAFDLSSLANLANQANPQQFNGPSMGQQQQQQQQQAFRRIPPQNQQTNRNQQTNNANSNLNMNFAEPPTQPSVGQRNQVPNGAPNGLLGGAANNANGFSQAGQTELPFIRQVFRPSPNNDGQEQPDGERAGGTRPTPPPLFVPARPISPLGSNPSQNSNKVTRVVESGFAPMQPSREMFFEPQSNRNNNNNNNGNRLMRQPGNNGASLVPAATSPPNLRPQQPVTEPSKRPSVRRPSQRPQPVSAARQPAEQAKPPQAPQVQTSTPDVIRLASSAIQTANQGLAAIAAAGESLAPSSTEAAEPSSSPVAPSSSSAPSTPNTPTSPTDAATPTSSATTPQSATEPQSTRRAVAGQLPPRSNFFTLSGLGATSSPATSFSPALPINAAVAAAGGRRRIPVRNSQQSAGANPSRGSQMAAIPTTTGLPVRSSVRRPEMEEFYETIGQNGLSSSPAEGSIEGFGATSRAQSSTSPPITVTSSEPTTASADLYGSRLNGPASDTSMPEASLSAAKLEPAVASSPPPSSPEPPPAQPAQQQAGREQQVVANSPVMVPVTYMTTLTYLTTVLHGTHTLETSHESVVRSTELATLNAQLMDQIEHRLPLIEPTATLSVSSKTKGKGTTIVNLKSQVSAYNQELVEALGVNLGQTSSAQPSQIQATSVLEPAPPASVGALPAATTPTNRLTSNRSRQPARVASQRPAGRPVEMAELERAKKSVVTEYQYLYTMRPLEANPESSQPEVTTSVRSELVSASLDSNELMNELMVGGAPQLIDSQGMLRVGRDPQAINLGE